MPGLGGSDPHALAAHTLRALTTPGRHPARAAPTDEPPPADASAYFTACLDVRGADPARTDAALAECDRSVAAALALPDIATRFGASRQTSSPVPRPGRIAWS